MLTILRGLRRLGGNGATLVALVATSTLLAVCGSLLAGGIRDEVPAQRYAGAPIVVGGSDVAVVSREGREKSVDLPGPRPLGGEVVDVVRDRARGAGATVVPDVSARVAARSTEDWIPVVAHGWSAHVLAPLRLVSGTAPATSGQVVVDAALGWSVGNTIEVLTESGPQSRTVVGTVALPGDAAPREPAIYLTDESARAMARRGSQDTVAAVGILPPANGFDAEKLAEDLSEALKDKGAVVATGNERGRVEFADVARARVDLQTLSGSLLAIVVLVTLIVVGSTCAVALSRRRGDVATLRAIGATPRQMEHLVVAEMAVVGAVAGVIGLVPASLMTTVLGGLLRGVGLLPRDFALSLDVIPGVAAVLLTTLIAVATGWATGRRSALVSPVAAMSSAAADERGAPRWMLVVGGALSVVGIAASFLPLVVKGIVGVAVASGGGLLLVFGAALLTRPVVGALLQVVARRLLASTTPHRWLAGAGMAGQAARLAAGVAPMMLIVGISLVQILVPASLAAAAQREAAAGLKTDHAVVGNGFGLPATTAPGGAVAVARQKVVGVTTVLGGPERFDYLATGFRGRLGEVVDLGLQPGATWDPASPLSADQAVVGTMTAASLGVSVGDEVELVLADGAKVTPRVVGIHERGLGLGDVIVNYDLLTSHRAVPDAAGSTADFLLLPRNAEPPRIGEIVAAAKAFGGGGDAVSNGIFASTVPLFALFAYVAVSVANSLVLSVTSRTSTFAMLRRIGADRRQLARSLVVEGVGVVVAAVGLGTVTALLPMVTVAFGLTGNPWPAIPWWFYLAVVAAVSALAMAAVVLPGRLVLHQRLDR
ncbi:putative ABC transport system permease protein [Streptoalloteichus tenebrarius]|uniref:ABC transport system permease protein n=1 Tax=Streptoalloteichus tenebrarius (strain ATCC 17920 / DSM 40477 / JCM 4838 / CBS 697.72 / NBRC 16177 / NCIMB 11028 / NRRL B-12390 / A12253. 1 / ISP 5477) TaxID=1933 RepID=A0ABT1HRT8_STRSD|nr:FtsX-like permease family protein [Streptoalloteichus tenebrarius]MCP2258235.1 putative ABC transport system permease protein [Streptoalloteichus tenebrarius]BFF04535.1 ABC transporter permease [Streptoalloteichus tenebrarius]